MHDKSRPEELFGMDRMQELGFRGYHGWEALEFVFRLALEDLGYSQEDDLGNVLGMSEKDELACFRFDRDHGWDGEVEVTLDGKELFEETLNLYDFVISSLMDSLVRSGIAPSQEKPKGIEDCPLEANPVAGIRGRECDAFGKPRRQRKPWQD